MTRKTLKSTAIVLCTGIMLSTHAWANEQPKMPYIFEKYCFGCHKEHVQTGPIGILDMRTKAGNPLNEEYIRSNIRFGYNAMPSFRPSEVSDKGMDEIVSYLKVLAAYRKAHPGYHPAAPERGGKK